MYILAIECSLPPGGIAIVSDGRVAREVSLSSDVNTGRALTPAIRELLQDVRVAAREIGLVALSTGPGSFTGLRVAATTAKTLAYAVHCPVLGVGSLQVIAEQGRTEFHSDASDSDLSGGGLASNTTNDDTRAGRNLYAVMDAQRRQLFVQRFRSTADGAIPDGEVAVVDQEAWLRDIENERGVIVGPIAGRFRDRVSSTLRIASLSVGIPRSSTVGMLAWRDWRGGCEPTDPMSLTIRYHRLSAAEEKLRGSTE